MKEQMTNQRTKNETLGSIKTDSEVLLKYAMNAALNTPGVANVKGNIPIIGNQGIQIDTEKSRNECEINIHLIVKFAYVIPEVAWNVQKNVKHDIETYTGEKVGSVNIHVTGIELPEGEEVTDEQN